MKPTAFTLLLMLVTFNGMAQTDSGIFPEMETETLEEKVVNIPKDLKGKFTLIGMAWSKKSEDALSGWFAPTYNQFIREPDKMDVFATEYDVNLFFVPMLTGHKTAVYKTAMNKARKQTSKEMYPHILFYKGNLKVYKKVLDMSDKKLPYFFLVNPDGDIVWSTSGYYSDSKMQVVIDKLDEALGEW